MVILHFKISFQDLEKVLNFAKMLMKYRNSMKIPKEREIILAE